MFVFQVLTSAVEIKSGYIVISENRIRSRIYQNYFSLYDKNHPQRRLLTRVGSFKSGTKSDLGHFGRFKRSESDRGLSADG